MLNKKYFKLGLRFKLIAVLLIKFGLDTDVSRRVSVCRFANFGREALPSKLINASSFNFFKINGGN
jgi:hypothetical protein